MPERYFFPTTQVTHFVLVRDGLTARIASTFDGQPGAGAMALSPPNRLACGNLNWTTHRPAIGRYMTLTHATLSSISHNQFDEVISDVPKEILRKLFMQFELNNLSDRMGFALLALMPAIVRFQALFLSWAVYFGTIENVSGEGDIVTMPAPGRRWHIEQVICSSSVTLDKIVAELAQTHGYERCGDFRLRTTGCGTATGTAFSTSAPSMSRISSTARSRANTIDRLRVRGLGRAIKPEQKRTKNPAIIALRFSGE